MQVRVVHFLEVVDVDHHDAGRMCASEYAVPLALECVLERGPAGRAGQAIAKQRPALAFGCKPLRGEGAGHEHDRESARANHSEDEQRPLAVARCEQRQYGRHEECLDELDAVVSAEECDLRQPAVDLDEQTAEEARAENRRNGEGGRNLDIQLPLLPCKPDEARDRSRAGSQPAVGGVTAQDEVLIARATDRA